MKQRITIEIEADEQTLEEMSRKIEAAAYGQGTAYADALCGFGIRKEILPEKVPGELKVPSFLVSRPFAERREVYVNGI